VFPTRVIFGQLHRRKGVADDLVQLSPIGIVITRQAHFFEPTAFGRSHFRLGKERVLLAEQLNCSKIIHPCGEAFQICRVDGIEGRVDGLGKLGVHIAGILKHLAVEQVDMLEAQ